MSQEPRPELHVLDGTAALFRAFFAMGAVSAPDGTPVGGVLGLAQWIERYRRRFAPAHGAVVFDAGARTFRNEIFADYKANRGEPPPELVPQFDLAVPLVEGLGIRSFRVPGFEADDLMATIARRSREAGLRVVLVTPDKDVCQLVDDGVLVRDPKSLEALDAAGVEARFGLRPDQLVDFQALCGDATDNVPGVPGIGPKSACALLAAFGTLEGIYEDLERVPELPVRGAARLAARLAGNREAAELSRRLVRLDPRVPLAEESLRLSDLRWHGPDPDHAVWTRTGLGPRVLRTA